MRSPLSRRSPHFQDKCVFRTLAVPVPGFTRRNTCSPAAGLQLVHPGHLSLHRTVSLYHPCACALLGPPVRARHLTLCRKMYATQGNPHSELSRYRPQFHMLCYSSKICSCSATLISLPVALTLTTVSGCCLANLFFRRPPSPYYYSQPLSAPDVKIKLDPS